MIHRAALRKSANFYSQFAMREKLHVVDYTVIFSEKQGALSIYSMRYKQPISLKFEH